MKLYTFEVNQQRRIGAEWQGQLVDLAVAYEACRALHRPETNRLSAFPKDMLTFIRLGAAAVEAAVEALAFGRKRRAVPVGEQILYPLEAVKLLAPLRRPGKIICSGMDQRSDQDENPATKISGEPFYFAKMPSTVIGPDEPILAPPNVEQLDSAIQFAAVIGKSMKKVAEADVLSCIFGYTILNDVFASDLQFQHNQIILGKNFDTFCPLGPCIMTVDEINVSGNVQLRTFLNGAIKQSGSTADCILPLPQLLSSLSQVMTLEPGDIVSTGTRIGGANPFLSMKTGDTIALEIDGIGRLENPVASR